MMERKRQIKIKTPKLFPWQYDVVKGILSYPNDIHIMKSKRQIGKSILVENLLLYYAINKRNSTSICISPTLNQSRKIYKEIRKAIVNLPIYESSNSTTLEITFTNGSQILLKSGEQSDGLRGNTVSGILCIDEAVFIKDQVIYEALPFVDANQAPILLTSTPKFKQGVFYEFYKRGEDGEKGFHSYDVNNYDTSVLLPPERLEMYRKAVAPQIFKSEFLGLWIDIVSHLFGDLEKLVGSVITPSKTKVLGIDFSNGGMDASDNPDETALVLMNEHKEVEKVWSFADKDATQTVDFIVDTIQRYGVTKVVAEANSMGRTYINLMKKKISSLHLRCQVVEWWTSQESKQNIIQDLQVECQNGTIQLINDNKLLLEMVSFEVSATKTGKLHYEGANSIKDDLVLALAFALYGLKKSTLSVRFV